MVYTVHFSVPLQVVMYTVPGVTCTAPLSPPISIALEVPHSASYKTRLLWQLDTDTARSAPWTGCRVARARCSVNYLRCYEPDSLLEVGEAAAGEGDGEAGEGGEAGGGDHTEHVTYLGRRAGGQVVQW